MNAISKLPKGIILLFIFLTFLLFTSYIYAATWKTDSQSTFDEGVYDNTEFDADSVGVREWSDAEKELPHNGITDQWGIDMTGNVLLMHLNEASGIIIDDSGNGNDGTYSAALYSQGGKLNSSIGFEGDGDSINVGHDASLDLTANMTISAWLKPTAYVNDGVILGKPHTSQANPYIAYALGYSANGRNYGLALGNGATQRGCYTDSNTVVLDEWTHFTATFDGTRMNLFINGELSKTCTFAYFAINQNTADVLLGDYPYFGSAYDYLGNIDELAIFNRSLSSQEIEDIYNRQAKKYGGNNPGNYVSKKLDALGNSKWENIAWVTEIPYGQELPNNQAAETGDFIRGIDMTGNVGLWHMDEASGNISDTSGNGNNGTINGGVAYGENGKFNDALSFNGTDAYVQIPNHSSINPTAELTLLAWFKWNIDPALGLSYASIINKNGDNQYRLHHNNANANFEFAIRTAPGTNRWVDSTSKPKQGEWYFVVGTYDGSVLKIYVNGVLENINNHVGTLVTSGSNLNIGRRTSNDRFFNGVIDEAAIFSRALSAQEIEDIYKRGALKLGLSVRSCDDSSCSGEGWTNLGDALTSPQNLTIIDNQFFQYKFDFDTENSDLTSLLNEVTIEYNSSPARPTNTMPLDLANNIGLTPHLIASAFSDAASDSHIDTDWRVDDDSDFSSSVWSRLAGTGEVQTTINGTNGFFANELSGETELDHETIYYWQVRYKDDGSNNWSNWSTSTSFTTLSQYTIIYDKNGATAGFIPANQTKIHGIDLTLQTNSGSLSKMGYDFTGWNTAINGTGIHYDEGASFTTEADTTLYSEWTIGICPTILNAATYNSYPTCGVATCNRGYTLKEAQCTSIGGGGYSPPPSSGSGPLDYYIDMYRQRSLGRLTDKGFNVMAYIGSTGLFDVITSGSNTVSQHKIKILDLDMAEKIVTLEISSNPQIIKMLQRDTRSIDLDEDSIPDISIEYNELLANRVDLTIVQLSFGNRFAVLNLKNGDVVKEYDDTTVFLIQDNQKRPFFNEDAYLGSGYQWSQVKEYSNLSAIPTGKMIYVSVSEQENTNANYRFIRDLSIGMIGDDAKELQKYLNSNGFILSTEGPGSPGNETTMFGHLTRESLIKYQKDKNISPAIGYFGPITREVINSQD